MKKKKGKYLDFSKRKESEDVLFKRENCINTPPRLGFSSHTSLCYQFKILHLSSIVMDKSDPSVSFCIF